MVRICCFTLLASLRESLGRLTPTSPDEAGTTSARRRKAKRLPLPNFRKADYPCACQQLWSRIRAFASEAHP